MHFNKNLCLVILGLISSSSAAEENTCTDKPWEIRDLTVFDAFPSATQPSFIGFSFSDPNFNIKDVPCVHTLSVDASPYKNSLASYGWIACDSGDLDIKFQFTAYELRVKRTAVECEGNSFVIYGTQSLKSAFFSLQCSPPSEGVRCYAPNPILIADLTIDA